MDEENTPKRSRFKMTRRTLLIALLVVGLLLTGVGLAIYKLQVPLSPFPESVKQAVSFPLYYPAPLPDGFTLDKSSIQGNHQVVLYTVTAPGGVAVSIAVQAREQDANMDAFYQQQLTDIRTISTKNGVAKMGKLNNQLFASMTTDKSWVIVTSKDTTLTGPVEQIMKSLRSDP